MSHVSDHVDMGKVHGWAYTLVLRALLNRKLATNRKLFLASCWAGVDHIEL